jgi:hypothetical protein
MKSLRTIFVGFAAAAALAGAPAALSDEGRGDNVVVAEVTTDGAFVPQSGVQVATTTGDSVHNTNFAFAHAKGCNGCNASAVAVQVLLVAGHPRDFQPQNAAIAVNESCTSCGTYAYAWQYAVQTDRPVHLDRDARERIAELRGEIARTTASIVPTDLAADGRLDAKLNGLTAQLKSIIDQQVRDEGQHGHGDVSQHRDESPGH